MTTPDLNVLGYLGLKEKTPPNVRNFKRDPLTSDYVGFDIGDIWINTLTPSSWQLMAKPHSPVAPFNTVANWQLIGTAPLTGVLTVTGNDAVAIAPIAGNIDILGSNGITASNSAPGTIQIADTSTITTDTGTAASFVAGNLDIKGGVGIDVTTVGPGSIIIDATGATFTWNVVTSVTNPNILASGNGYIAKGAGVVEFVLPAAAAIGYIFEIVGNGNLWTLSQNALQTISLGSKTTTPGIGGSIAATQVKDSIRILCVSANTEFEIIYSVGNLTFI